MKTVFPCWQVPAALAARAMVLQLAARVNSARPAIARVKQKIMPG